MQDQKMENLLNLALDASEEGRRKSLDLDVGYQPETRRWQVIVRYSGDLKAYESPEIRIAELTGGYAIVTLSESRLYVFAALPEVEYMEMPKRLFFSLNQARSVSCVQPVQEAPRSLTGQGVLVAVVDSGADWRHPDFQTADGRSRIVLLWDQTLEGPPPEGYTYGTEFTGRELDAALAAKREGGLPGATGSPQAAGGLGREDRPPASASRDVSGHGTGVLGIAAGNGRASGGRYRGVAPEADILVVKLGTSEPDGFPRTTELMQAVDYAVRAARSRNQPLALNLSFGNTYGSHEPCPQGITIR